APAGTRPIGYGHARGGHQGLPQLNATASSAMPSEAIPASYGVEPPEAALQPLLAQLAQMQQQMCDQFQQATMMMAQLFSTMHRDQMQIIREELTHIRELSQEMRRLQGPAREESPGPSSDQSAAAEPREAPTGSGVAAEP